MNNKITTLEMECEIARFLNPRANLIVPNVSWGLDLHECDLLVIARSGYAWEVEIKVSKADLVKDKQKRHRHWSHKIRSLYFAIPDYLLEHQHHIPERAGIIVVERCKEYSYWKKKDEESLRAKRLRMPKPNGNYKFSDQERYAVARLGALRIWTLKRKIRDGEGKA